MNKNYLLLFIVAFLSLSINASFAKNQHEETDSTIQYITPDNMSSPPHFSRVVIATGQKTIYISGMTGKYNNKSDALDEYESQLRQAFMNIGIALKAAGVQPKHVVRQRVQIVGISQKHAAITRKVMQEFYGDARPASTATGTSGLFNPDLVVEVDVTANVNK
jgi:enamine deaminase RidA (YjgF/YER057c/UK114 family)